MRENLIKEKHSGGLGGHFGADKTYEQLNRFYFWPKMRSKVEKYVKNYKVCQYAKGRKPEHRFVCSKIGRAHV